MVNVTDVRVRSTEQMLRFGSDDSHVGHQIQSEIQSGTSSATAL
jgi:hypothetical protein